MGDCSYTLAQAKDKTFSITVRNVKCGSFGVTCTKEVYIAILGNFIHLVMGKTPTINDVQIPPSGYKGTGLEIRYAGLFLIVFSDHGLTVLWDFGRFYICFLLYDTKFYMQLFNTKI